MKYLVMGTSAQTWASNTAVNAVFDLICGIVLIAILIGLVKSAINSWKKTGGKITSIVDEIIIGVIVLIMFFMVSSLELSVIFDFVSKIILFIWNIITSILRTVGVPV